MLAQSVRKGLALLLLLIPGSLFLARAKTLLIDDSDDNSHLCLYVGDTLTIKLPSNPTTGYQWGQPEGIANLELLSSRPEPGGADRAGAPGFQVFSFKATAPGESTLTLNYFRPFEKDSLPGRAFLLTLSVSPRPFIANSSSPKP